ncbi:Hsp20 family protein [Streptococcus thermophilus]
MLNKIQQRNSDTYSVTPFNFFEDFRRNLFNDFFEDFSRNLFNDYKPNVKEDEIKASYSDGILKVTLPKDSSSTPLIISPISLLIFLSRLNPS